MSRQVIATGVEWLLENGLAGNDLVLVMLDGSTAFPVPSTATTVGDLAGYELVTAGYHRKTLTSVDLSVSGGVVRLTADTVVYSSLGTAAGPVVSTLVVAVDVSGADSAKPLLAVTGVHLQTNGMQVTINFSSTGLVTWEGSS